RTCSGCWLTVVSNGSDEKSQSSAAEVAPLAGKNDSDGGMMEFVLDIGGEGRHEEAWNLNPRALRTIGPRRGEPIARRIAGRAGAIPLADESVDRIVMERTPLTRAALVEMARVAKAQGTITLRHATSPSFDPHRLARQILPGWKSERSVQIGRQVLQETCFQLR
ncbi:MAG: hypothetical protein AAF961_00720, partial [Planctomycetota bacterium]